MHKTLTALALAATIAVAAVAAPQAAEARDHGAVAAGIIGGLAAGAIIGSAAANNGYYGNGGYYYGPGPYAYQPEPVYVEPAPRPYYRGGSGCWHVTDSDRGYGYYGACY